MGFWIFLTISVLIVPTTMIVFGTIFLRHEPKEINTFFGYRTARSMKNADTWIFAHRYIARLWLLFGIGLLALAIAAMVYLFDESMSTMMIICGVVSAIETVFMVIPIFPTELALKKRFFTDEATEEPSEVSAEETEASEKQIEQDEQVDSDEPDVADEQEDKIEENEQPEDSDSSEGEQELADADGVTDQSELTDVGDAALVAPIPILIEKDGYTFRPITMDEISAMFELIMSRVKWMDEVGIEQWNMTKYDEVYPMSYYEEHAQNEEVFVLVEAETERMVCAAVMKHVDDRWPADEVRALYLHNFASAIDAKGTGSIFLELAEKHAAEQGMEFLRLDSAVGNEKLESYYTERGYVACGECVDGLYSGILRQKKIQKDI